MDELEIERQTLQLTAEQARINPNHTEIEDFLKDDSELADEKRHLSLPEAHVAEGAQVHHKVSISHFLYIVLFENEHFSFATERKPQK